LETEIEGIALDSEDLRSTLDYKESQEVRSTKVKYYFQDGLQMKSYFAK